MSTVSLLWNLEFNAWNFPTGVGRLSSGQSQWAVAVGRREQSSGVQSYKVQDSKVVPII
jgi:hypothetical protein